MAVLEQYPEISVLIKAGFLLEDGPFLKSQQTDQNLFYHDKNGKQLLAFMGGEDFHYLPRKGESRSILKAMTHSADAYVGICNAYASITNGHSWAIYKYPGSDHTQVHFSKYDKSLFGSVETLVIPTKARLTAGVIPSNIKGVSTGFMQAVHPIVAKHVAADVMIDSALQMLPKHSIAYHALSAYGSNCLYYPVRALEAVGIEVSKQFSLGKFTFSPQQFSKSLEKYGQKKNSQPLLRMYIGEFTDALDAYIGFYKMGDTANTLCFSTYNLTEDVRNKIDKMGSSLHPEVALHALERRDAGFLKKLLSGEVSESVSISLEQMLMAQIAIENKEVPRITRGVDIARNALDVVSETHAVLAKPNVRFTR